MIPDHTVGVTLVVTLNAQTILLYHFLIQILWYNIQNKWSTYADTENR